MDRSSLLALALALPPLAAAAAPEDAAPAPPPRAAVEDLLIARDFAGAARLASERLATATDGADELRLLRAVARLAAGEPDGALEDLRAVAGGGGRLGLKARFRMADVLAELGRISEALEVERDVVAELRRPERRAEIAALYLDAAREALHPPASALDPEPKPNWELGRSLLQKAEELQDLGGGAAEAALELLRCADALGEAPELRIDRARAFLARHAADPAAAEVLFLLGSAEVAVDPLAARATWLTLADRQRQSPFAPLALDRIARALAADAAAAGAESARGAQALQLALEATERLAAEHPRDALVPPLLDFAASALDALPALAGRRLALVERLLAEHPTSDLVGRAALQKSAALADRGDVDGAIEFLRGFAQGRPVDQHGRAALARAVDLRFDAAQGFLARGKYAAPETGRAASFEEARRHFQAFLAAAADDARVPAALLAQAEMDALEGKVEAALAEYRALADRFPASDAAAPARLAIARLYAESVQDYEQAFAAIRQIPAGTREAAKGAALAEQLRAPELALEAGRTFMSGAPATVELATRNVDRVTVAVYEVDLAELFRATGGLEALATLDVGLIKPDRTFEVAIEGYRPWHRFRQSIQIERERPGAAVVAVRAGLLEARTAVIASDLDLLVAATRREVTLLAARRGGTAAVALDASRVAADGKLLPERAGVPDPFAAREIGAFARASEGAAFAAAIVADLSRAPDPVELGWLALDRGTVRPGEAVHAFGAVRVPKGRALAPPDSGSYRLDLIDLDANRIVESARLEVSTTGSFQAEFGIDAGCGGPRTFAIALAAEHASPERELARARFTVAQFPAPPVVVEFDLPLAGVARGQAASIGATLREGASGSPLALEPAEYTVAGLARTSVRADLAGRVRLELPESATRRPGTVAIELVARGVASSAEVSVRSRTADLAPTGWFKDGGAALAGEPAALALRATDETGAGAALELRFTVLAPAVLKPLVAVAAGTVTSSAEGDATFTFTPERAGPHVVRAEWDDEFGLPRRREWPLIVAGGGDGIAVHLLPERPDPAPGGALRLRVHSELPAGPATLLLLSDRLEWSERVTLAEGLSTFSVPIPAEGPAELRLACSVARGDVVSMPEVALRPRAALDLSVTADSSRALAGGGVAVAAHLRDAAGDNVTGELALVLVRAADAPAFAAANPSDVFHGVLPGRFVAVGSSAAFRPAAVAERFDPALGRALEALASAADAPAQVMVQEVDLERLVQNRPLPGQEEEAQEETAGFSGAGGARYGGRMAGGAGKRAAQTAQALGERALPPYVPAPLAFRCGIRFDAGDAAAALPLPPEPGRYTLFAFAAGVGSRFGVARVEFEVARPEIDFDVIYPAVARGMASAPVHVHVASNVALPRTVAVEHTFGSRTETRTLELAPLGAGIASFSIPLLIDGSGILEATVAVAGRSRSIRIDALPDLDLAPIARSGRVAGSARVAIAGLPEESDKAALDVRVDAGARAPLLAAAEAALAAAILDPLDREQASLRVWIAAEALLAARPEPALKSRADALSAAAERELGHLLALLDGAVLVRERELGDALALPALARIEQAGLKVPAGRADAVRDAVDRALAGARDASQRAYFLFCRALGGGADFALLNRLLRERSGLGLRDTALLGAALAASGRTQEAASLMQELAAKAPEPGAGTPGIPALEDPSPPVATSEEITAVALYAARLAQVEHAAYARASDWLFGRLADPDVAPLALLLARAADALREGGPAADRVLVRAGGKVVATLDLAAGSASVSLFPADLAGAGEVLLAAENAGTFCFAAVHGYRVRPQPAGAGAAPVIVERSFVRTHADRDGAEYAVAFIERAPPVRPRYPTTATALRALRSATVRLEITLRPAAGAGDFWIFEPQPLSAAPVAVVSGAAAVRRTARGMWLLVHRPFAEHTSHSILYSIVPPLPGEFQLPPARVRRGRHGPDLASEARGESAYRVVPFGAGKDDGIELSSNERFEMGRAAFARDDFEQARALLLPLLGLELREEQGRELLRTLLLASLERKASTDVVRCFEMLKESDPDYVVPFAAMQGVGTAYAELGEAERARQVFAAVADATFLEEAQVVGRLEKAGRERSAFAAMHRLLRESSDSEPVRATWIALGQHAHSAAKPRASAASGGEILSSAELLDTAVGALRAYLAELPRATDADEVTLVLLNAYLDQGRFDRARELARSAATRFQGPRFDASWTYFEAFAALALGDLDGAAALCDRLVDRKAGAAAADVDLAPLARHMRAQIRHARGDVAGAREDYRAVAALYEDAARSLAWLDRQGLQVPAVTLLTPAEALSLPLRHRGTAARLDVAVYPVDLRLLYLRHRSFDRLAEVELAGITPVATASVDLRPGAAEQKVAIPLDGIGAYLLVLKAGDLQARCMAIRSDLSLEVELTAGEARAHAASATTGAARPGALVSFVGDFRGDFAARKCDLRGIAAVPLPEGRVAVIAELDGHYAYFQGEEPAQGQRDRAAEAGEDESARRLKDVQDKALDESRKKNEQNWLDNTNREQTGVEVQRTKR